MKKKQDYETRKQDYGTMTNKTMKHERKGEDFAMTVSEPGN